MTAVKQAASSKAAVQRHQRSGWKLWLAKE